MRFPTRTLIVLAIDVFMTAFSLVAAYVLLHGLGHLSLLRFKVAAAALAGLALIVYPSYGIYRNHWRYVSIVDLSLLGQAAVFLLSVFYGLWWCVGFPPLSPASTYPIIHLMVLIFCLGIPRLFRRALADPHLLKRLFSGKLEGKGRSILLVASPDEAELFIRAQSLAAPGTAFHILGICDPAGRSVGRAIHGIKVLGTPAQLGEVLARLPEHPSRLGVSKHAFSALPSDFETICSTYGLSINQLPDASDVDERADASQLLKPVAIEDILGRSQRVIDLANAKGMLEGKSVIVTGAGGSIGSELVRQIATLNPSKLIIVEHSEYGLYHIDRQCAEEFPHINRISLLGDVRNEYAMEAIFAAHKPEAVYHAAALKHVPIVEWQPYEGILTNVLGTKIVAEAAARHGAKVFVMISTDKAVAPLSVMGASKRVAEMLVQAMDRKNRGTRFMSVRFGNVLGSSGSVVPLFRHQIAQGGPVTVTHQDMTRFFMTIREAVGLVLQASVEGLKSTARGAVYVLDMGRPVRIYDVAAQMIRLAGLVPDKDVKIEIVGLRPGEKMHESLFCTHESPRDTGLLTVMEAVTEEKDADVSALLQAAQSQDNTGVYRELRALIVDCEINA